jgi:HAD superfamily hydrolase (TIGR01509 family)
MAFSNIIFDFDGTITDSRWDIASAQKWVLGQIGVDSVKEEDLFPHIGKTLEETFALLLPPSLHSRIVDATRLYSEYYPPRSLQTTTLFPGVRETLLALHRRGKYMAIASTKKEKGIRRATDHFDITGYFTQLQGSDGIPYKPDPAIIHKILDQQRWEQTDTLMVGDTDKDVLAGKNAGVATCAVTYGALTRDELNAHEPDFIISRFSELLGIV